MGPSPEGYEQENSTPSDILQLRLYMAGNSPNSVRALKNIRAICQELVPDDGWHLEVVDVFTDPLRAVEDKVLLTPTLLKLTPPVVQIVGDLSQRETVLAALDLARSEK